MTSTNDFIHEEAAPTQRPPLTNVRSAPTQMRSLVFPSSPPYPTTAVAKRNKPFLKELADSKAEYSALNVGAA
jgi:hypothetical protein